MKTDIEIAQSVDLQPIADVVKKVGIDYDDLELTVNTRRNYLLTRFRNCRRSQLVS